MTSVPKSSQASDQKAKRILPHKSEGMQDGGRDQMLWQWGKGWGSVGTVSHKHRWCSSLKKNVWESFRQRRWEVLHQKEILWGCVQAQRGRRARLSQGTIGSWHSWSLVCLCGQVLRGENGWGKRGQLWGSEAFTGKVMRSLGTTRVNLDLMLVGIRNHDHILNWKYLANILEVALASYGIIATMWAIFCKDFLSRMKPRVNGYRLWSVRKPLNYLSVGPNSVSSRFIDLF